MSTAIEPPGLSETQRQIVELAREFARTKIEPFAAEWDRRAYFARDVIDELGRLGFPEWGLIGAGVATVAGAWASAVLGLGLMMRTRYRRENATASGWRFDPASGHAELHGYCPCGTCRIVQVWSTPKNDDNHARRLRRAFDGCPNAK